MHTIELEKGGQYTCTLPGRASAGYLWEHTVEGESNVISIDETSVYSPLLERNGDLPAAGYSADVQFTITACAPGKVTIRFSLRRSWETNKPPLDERFLNIFVYSHSSE